MPLYFITRKKCIRYTLVPWITMDGFLPMKKTAIESKEKGFFSFAQKQRKTINYLVKLTYTEIMGTISIAHTRWKPLCSISTYASEDFGKSDSYGLNFCTINIWDLKKRFRQRAMIHFNSFRLAVSLIRKRELVKSKRNQKHDYFNWQLPLMLLSIQKVL